MQANGGVVRRDAGIVGESAYLDTVEIDRAEGRLVFWLECFEHARNAAAYLP